MKSNINSYANLYKSAEKVKKVSAFWDDYFNRHPDETANASPSDQTQSKLPEPRNASQAEEVCNNPSYQTEMNRLKK